MSKVSRRKTLSHTDIESFLSEMAVPVKTVDIIHNVHNENEQNLSKSNLSCQNIPVEEKDAKSAMRDLCRVRPFTIAT